MVWMGVIFYLSSQPAADSSELSNGLLDSILSFLRIQVEPNTKEFLEKLIRKLAHLVEYAILGLFAIKTLKNFNVKKACYLAILLCVIYAISDEIHQTFILNRYGSASDVLLDSLGSFLSVFFVHLIENNASKRKGFKHWN